MIPEISIRVLVRVPIGPVGPTAPSKSFEFRVFIKSAALTPKKVVPTGFFNNPVESTDTALVEGVGAEVGEDRVMNIAV